MAFSISSLTASNFVSDNAALLQRYRYFRIFLYLANVVILSLGIACLSTASSYLTSRAATLLTTQLAVGAIVLGIFVILLAIWGLLATFREAKYALAVYEMVVALVSVCLFGVSIAVAVQKQNAGDLIITAWEDLYIEHNWNTLNSVQQAFGCCGLFNYSDAWTPTYIYYYAPYNLTLNISLCPGSGIDLDPHTHQDLHPSLSSCYSAIYSLYTENVAAAAGVGITLAVLLFAIVTISILASLAIRRMQKEELDKKAGQNGDGGRTTEEGEQKMIEATKDFHVMGEQRLRQIQQQEEDDQTDIVVDAGHSNGNRYGDNGQAVFE